MRSSTLVLAALSALAIAAPVEKRVYVTDITTAFVTVTVTEGQERPTLRPVSLSKSLSQDGGLLPVIYNDADRQQDCSSFS